MWIDVDTCAYPGRSFSEGDHDEKTASLTERTFSFYGSFMRLHHSLYIAKAQAKSFYVMNIAGMGTIEFLKDAAQCFFIHTDTIVFDPDPDVIARIRSR